MKKNSTSTALILGSARSGNLADALLGLGYLPLIRDNMFAALEAIRHYSFRAIFIDQKQATIDALEFILNVRDFDKHTPIVVMKSKIQKSEKDLVLKQKNVLLLESVQELLEMEHGELI